MSDDFIEMINDIDLLYGFIYERNDLVNTLYNHNNYDHLAIKLHSNFVLPIINITKNEHIKEYNERVNDSKYVNRNCLYLMNICYEKYFKLSKDEYSKIKKLIDDNIDTFESMLAPISSVKWGHLGHFDLEPNQHNFPTNPMGSSGTLWARLYNNNYKN